MGRYGGAMGEVRNGDTPASEIALDRLTELALSDEPEYPNDTVLMPSDLPELGERLSRALEREVPLVIVYPDGRERFIAAPALPRRS
jgi:hypothetical protein